MSELVELRRRLHSHPELSHQEEHTAATIREFLEQSAPDKIVTGIGGHGLAVVFSGNEQGPRVLVRAELDALPIQERVELEYGSQFKQVSHKCGHDGHMTILAGLARHLVSQRPSRGSVMLLFQPAEETGEGAAMVLADKKFAALKPDYAIALHNLPGYPLGQVIMRENVFASASSGLIVKLIGQTAHAAQPQLGRSPALAVAHLIQAFSSLPQFHTALHEAAKVTVIHARLGEVAFGTTPGRAEVMATIRSHLPDVMDRLTERAAELANGVAASYGLKIETKLTQVFPATENDPELVNVIVQSATELGLKVTRMETPFGWSEDFGHFTEKFRGALFGLGAGTDHPALHNPDYDFPDKLIEPGVKLFAGIVEKLLSEDHV